MSSPDAHPNRPPRTASSISLGTRSATPGHDHPVASIVLSGHDDQGAGSIAGVLKARVAELEANMAREAHKFQRAAAEHDKLLTQLLTARRNNDILSGNIDALKTLTTQLATQLEDTRSELATLRDTTQTSDMKLRRDAALELVRAEKVYEAQLDELRAALKEQKAVADHLREAGKDADVRAEIEVARVSEAKDIMIAELRREMDVMRGRITYIEATRATGTSGSGGIGVNTAASAALVNTPQLQRSRSRTGNRRATGLLDATAVSPSALTPVVASDRALMLPTQRPSGSRLAGTAWDSLSESEVSAAHRAVVDVKICINKEDFMRAKWRVAGSVPRGQMGPSAAVVARAGPSRYHIDVTTDGGFVDSVPFTDTAVEHRSISVDSSDDVAASPGAALLHKLMSRERAKSSPLRFCPPGVSVAATLARECCAFLTASGEEIRVIVEVAPRATDASPAAADIGH
jgi:hypothetical protein